MAEIIKKEQQKLTGTAAAPAPQAAASQAAAPQAAASQAAPTSLKGVSEATAGKLNQYGQGYRPSGSVQAAQDYLNGILNKRPVADAQLSQLYDQIMNREKFHYDLNGDALYQQYKDQYQNLGRQAMLDTMGNAAALTGGYGNSYASTAGNQAYQAYLQQLNSIVPDLYRAAYERYSQEGNDLANRYNMAYGAYRDAMGDWEAERNFANSDYWRKYEADYADYQNMFSYWNQQAQQESETFYTERDFAYKLAMAIIKKKKMPSAALLAAAGITEGIAKKLGARASSSSGGGGSSSRSSSKSSSSGAGLSYGELSGYLNNGTMREQMTGSRDYSSSDFEKLVSASAKAGTISSAQADALRKGGASKSEMMKKYGK